MDGVLVVDKPQGLTSHDVVAAARRILRERRIGHTGTLDPLATGVLPLACGIATRLVRFLTASEKDYDATIRFGLTTDSYDITGREQSRSGLVPSREQVVDALARLRGDHMQTPPAFSAKKVAGRRAYALARNNEPVALAAVPVRLSRVDLLALDGADASVSLTCSPGFYVRAFAHMVGELVGAGACLVELRRTRSGAFDLAQAVPLERLAEAGTSVVGLQNLLTELPAAVVTAEGRERVTHGREFSVEQVVADVVPEAGWVRVLDDGGQLLALAQPGGAPGSLHPKVVLT